MNTHVSTNVLRAFQKFLSVFVIVLVTMSISLNVPISLAASNNKAATKVKTVYFTEKQAKLLTLAYKYGSEIGYPETLQAILLQESNAGTANKIGDANESVGRRSYGRMQIKVATVRHVLPWYPAISKKYFNGKQPRNILDEEIIVVLLTNDEANIEIAAKVFEFKLKEADGSWAKAVASYNLGIWGAKKILHHSKFPYVADVYHKIHTVVRPFNNRVGLSNDSDVENKMIAATQSAQTSKPKKVSNPKTNSEDKKTLATAL